MSYACKKEKNPHTQFAYPRSPKDGDLGTRFKDVRAFPRWNWNLELLVFVEGGKPENLGEKPSEQGRNQQQTKT